MAVAKKKPAQSAAIKKVVAKKATVKKVTARPPLQNQRLLKPRHLLPRLQFQKWES